MTTPTRLNAVEIAKVIRARIKAAQKAGKLSKAIKISVRSDSYSQGSSVDVRIMFAPFQIQRAAFMAAYLRAQYGDEPRHTPRAASLLLMLETDICEGFMNLGRHSPCVSVDFATEATEGEWEIARALRDSVQWPRDWQPLRMVSGGAQ
jgi:hypothetical protein